ncbi:MAG: hypothetical protein ABIK52_09010, partial [Bacteroidota bacterium]
VSIHLGVTAGRETRDPPTDDQHSFSHSRYVYTTASKIQKPAWKKMIFLVLGLKSTIFTSHIKLKHPS